MRVPSSPKARSPSPSSSRSARQYLRPLLLANRARTRLPRPPFNPKRAKVSSPRHYKMTKSVREDPREPVKHVLPEIKVTPPVPTPTAWAQGATSAVQEAGTFPDVPARSSSRQATMFAPDVSFNPFEQATPPLENVNPRYLTLPDENAATPQLTPIQSEYTLTHCDHVPTHCVPYPNLQVAPHALRRVGNAWDFMPSIQFPGRRTPINNPSRQRIVRRHAEETVGRAL